MRFTHDGGAARHRSNRLARITVGTGVTTLLALGIAGPAFAHVKVSGIDTTQGGYGVLTFRVPSESATASTTELTVIFPSSTPISSVDTQPKAGWTAKVTTKHLAKPIKNEDGTIDTYVSQVDWKAKTKANAIPPGQFDMFNLSVGPLPKTPTLTLPAVQHYSDGTIVKWNEIAATGAAEPAHPAPVLQLPPAAGTSATATPTGGVSVSAARPNDTQSGSPAWPGLAGLVAGILGLIAGVTALVRANQK